MEKADAIYEEKILKADRFKCLRIVSGFDSINGLLFIKLNYQDMGLLKLRMYKY